MLFSNTQVQFAVKVNNSPESVLDVMVVVGWGSDSWHRGVSLVTMYMYSTTVLLTLLSQLLILFHSRLIRMRQK